VYAALRELGRAGAANLIDRCCDHARQLVRGLGTLSEVEVVAYPTLNQGLVRFLENPPHGNDAADDAKTDRIIDAINREGTSFFSGTTWQGRRAMRISVVNWRTTHDSIERTVRAVAQVLESERRSPPRGASA
jgi:aromatic-L-amino-acid decarboxylase